MGIKKGIFYTLDAIIALTVVIALLLIAQPVINYQPFEEKLHYDILTAISNLQIGEVPDVTIQSWIQQGIITDASKTVIEQIGEFYLTNETNKTKAVILANLMLSSIPNNRNIGIWVGNELLASKGPIAELEAKNIDVTRQVISGIREGENITGFSARAFLSSSSQVKYYFFGGYVGDGNITAPINYKGEISSVSTELTSNINFSIYVNNNFIGNYQKSPDEFTPVKYDFPSTAMQYFFSGSNNVSFRQNNGENLRISGGFVKVSYNSTDLYEVENRKYFPGVKGIINVYDGFYAPNSLKSLKAYLHFNSTEQLNFTIGNTSIYDYNGTGANSVTLDNVYLSSKLDYNSLANRTTPYRIFIGGANITSTGKGDIVLITDVSGSMDWRMDADGINGINRTCSDSLIDDASTKRISVAKCIDINFTQTMLLNPENRIALVSFSTNANNYVNLTANKTLLNNTINSYAASGSTCISCAINRAYEILNSQGSSDRPKYIVVMTDGEPNIRSTGKCMNSNSAINISNPFFEVGDSGFSGMLNSNWNLVNSTTNSNINDISFLNSTFGFAVGDSGSIIKWNGTGWNKTYSPVANNLNGVEMINSTFGFAVGDSGKILLYNKTYWVEINDTGNNVIRKVKFLNSTFGFAVGDSGLVYRWNGVNWAYYTTLGQNLYNLDFFNNSFAFIVGNSGKIYRWNGASIFEIQDIGSQVILDIDIFNSTYALLSTTGNTIYRWNGSNFFLNYTGSYDINYVKILNETSAYAAGDSREGFLMSNNNAWQKTFPDILFSGNSSTGIGCSDSDSCSLDKNIPMLNANYSSCRANKDLNATIYSVGFGPLSVCNLALKTLQSIAQCGKGENFTSSNANQLKIIYQQISELIKVSYKEQISTSISNVSTELFPDSYIEFEFEREKVPFGLVLTSEKNFANANSGNFTAIPGSKIIDARVISYSGPRWTSLVTANNIQSYNLSIYGSDYSILGDPYSINLKLSSINQTGLNTVNLQTGTSPLNISSGSASNKIIYTIVKNLTTFNTTIVASASGCIWNISLEDGSTKKLIIPSAYSGSVQCYYPDSASLPYNKNDAFQQAAYELFKALDFDNNGKVDFSLEQNNLGIETSPILGIPFTWNLEVQVRTWS